MKSLLNILKKLFFVEKRTALQKLLKKYSVDSWEIRAYIYPLIKAWIYKNELQHIGKVKKYTNNELEFIELFLKKDIYFMKHYKFIVYNFDKI